MREINKMKSTMKQRNSQNSGSDYFKRGKILRWCYLEGVSEWSLNSSVPDRDLLGSVWKSRARMYENPQGSRHQAILRTVELYKSRLYVPPDSECPVQSRIRIFDRDSSFISGTSTQGAFVCEVQ